MILQEKQINHFLKVRQQIKGHQPLIHYITHAITMNDSANVILGLGAKPIMAEHPLEVREVTRKAQALAVNLGNISDSRMMAMEKASLEAYQDQIPWCIDLVGVGCSTLRKNYAKQLIQSHHPQLIKGNMSEIKAMSKQVSHAHGIDVGKEDQVTKRDLLRQAQGLMKVARNYETVVVATGAIDLVADAMQCYAIYNGCQLLTQLTGTGCMLTGMIAAFMAETGALESALMATIMMGIAGERAKKAKGNGSFKTMLLDELYVMTDESIQEAMRCERIDA